ncbi:MAG: type II toxin-antitoxin system HipA family toxin [Dokdonella sp.]|uniref:type II toxin-antitoxin system HipA family toxin n=1 Tax=Dokdonella sp. TaxID=2291710 RepID=UPI0025C33CAB|nr:HipA domain-containing protein [Dokdonella sp.]MBX3701907.1 type II toxin-antitoxin system HipA family toxin [Dokdonella sp.]
MSECFVYITLPGQVQAVTAGRFALEVGRNGVPVGRFVYGRRYLQRDDAVEFDPVELRLGEREYQTTHHKGVFGVLRDAGPDYWGRLVIERHAGRAPADELGYLLESADDRAGALGFGLNVEPPAPRREYNQTLELAKLQETAEALLDAGERVADVTTTQIAELLRAGTSMGGARPKVVVEDDGALWLAKFNLKDDRWNMARVEHAMLRLAARCGLEVAQSKVVSVAGRDVLLVRRFDRDKADGGYLRHRMVSALSLLRADEGYHDRPRWSYLLLVEEVRRTCLQAEKDAQELFRRMCFNALISNNDDHPRNHALLARDRHWGLSPVYDLTPNPQVSIERRDLALTVGDFGRAATAENLLSQSARFGLRHDDAAEVVEAMRATVQSQWFAIARAAGVSDGDCARIAGAFAYPGFQSAGERK